MKLACGNKRNPTYSALPQTSIITHADDPAERPIDWQPSTNPDVWVNDEHDQSNAEDKSSEAADDAMAIAQSVDGAEAQSKTDLTAAVGEVDCTSAPWLR